MLAMPDPRLVPTVRNLMIETRNNSRIASYFTYFAEIGDEAACLETLERLGLISAEEIAEESDPGRRQRAEEFAAYLVRECADDAGKFKRTWPALLAKLGKLAEMYPPKEEAEDSNSE